MRIYYVVFGFGYVPSLVMATLPPYGPFLAALFSLGQDLVGYLMTLLTVTLGKDA